ncbi:MAG: hypothetical protein AAFR55_04915 [Pseudomonadota bacterium]
MSTQIRGTDASRDATPCPDEIEDMASMLEGQHGQFAADVADFFSAVHGQSGDASRAWAWQGVAVRVRRRERARGVPETQTAMMPPRPQ